MVAQARGVKFKLHPSYDEWEPLCGNLHDPESPINVALEDVALHFGYQDVEDFLEMMRKNGDPFAGHR